MTTTDHQHDHLTGEALADAARAALLDNGEQWTALRASVFHALAAFDKPASAYDVTDAVSAAQERRVAANSVYRILDLFVQANVAQRVESQNAYLVSAHPGCRHDCIFLICDRCQATVHIDDDLISDMVRRSASDTGFLPSRPILEVRGLCRSCR